MKILIRLMDKIQARTHLDEQDTMIAEMPIYKIMGFTDEKQCAKALRKKFNH
jgi:hypothetical protein